MCGLRLTVDCVLTVCVPCNANVVFGVLLKLGTLIRRFIVVLQSDQILCSYIEMLQTYN